MTPAKIGRYEIQGELGRGAMGSVYRAFDPTIGRHLAIKIIPLNPADSELGPRFRREAQAAGVLSHPNIVTIYDAGADGDFLYIAMELVQGETLQQILSRGPLAVEQAVLLAGQVAAALDHAHAREIIHRDIKPANIMVQQGQAKVTDFGIAKISATGMTSTGQILGTPSYLSPEVVKGEAADARSDLFSLGVVLYEMLTGTCPFGGSNITTVIYKVISEQPSAPSALVCSLPAQLDHVAMKALAKEPAQRYQSCAEFMADLKNHVATVETGGSVAQLEGIAPASPLEPRSASLQPTSKTVGLKAMELPGLGNAGPTKPSGRALFHKKSVWAAAALALLALAGGLAWQASQSGKSTYTATKAASTTARPRQTTARVTPSPRPAASRPRPSEPSPPLSEAAAASPAPPPDRASAGVGRVIIHTEPPGASILVNGQATSYRAPVNFALAPGQYEITMEQEGYVSRTEAVAIHAHQTVEFRITLEPTAAALRRFPILRRLPFPRPSNPRRR